MGTQEYSHPEETPSKKGKFSGPLIWKILAIVFIVVSIVLLIALIVVAAKSGVKKEKHRQEQNNGNEPLKTCGKESAPLKVERSASGLFQDLSKDEILAVRDYILADKSLDMTPYDKATINSNYIYFIKLQPPSKADALNFLQNNGPKPARVALVSVFSGGKTVPIVEEFLVSPANKPTKHVENRIPGQRYPIPFDSRPFDETVEAREINRILRKITTKAHKLLLESYGGYSYVNCTKKCLTYMYASPMGFKSTTRKAWYWLMRNVPGKYEHAINFEVFIDHKGADVSKWTVEQIVYNNQSFPSADALMDAYDKKTLKTISIPAPDGPEIDFSSYKPHGKAEPAKPSRGPEQYEPDGKRYALDKNRVEYMGWGFEFRVDSINGIELYDIQFKKERIIYELSLQEAIATYTGYYPSQTYMYYLDGNWRLGMSSYELVPGIDCPKTATFLDLTHLIGTSTTVTMKNAVCVFELNTGIPLRRHYDSDFEGGYHFYGGMANNALVVRTIPTVYNYDYVWDFIFYQNAVIQVKLSASGYLMGSFYTDEVKPYAYRLNGYQTSAVHDHLANFRVDFDVGGTSNCFETVEIGIENSTSPWEPDFYRVKKVLIPDTKKTERDALYKYNFDRPKYLNFYNSKAKNGAGVNKGYRLQINGVQKLLYPENWEFVPMISWGLYQMAVTKHNENERQSSSAYNQNAPSDPQVDFRNYVGNESIVDQDLVAWVSLGMMHVPHSEDYPNTATVANSASFFIRPFNYFDNDPSMGSTNAILITPSDKEANGQQIERRGTPTGPSCVPANSTSSFRYGGRYDGNGSRYGG